MFYKQLIASRYAPYALFSFLFIIRLYQINSPIVDAHSWNQISAASMAKHIYFSWDAILKPMVDLYHSLEHPTQIYAQEFPLYHIPIALIYHLTGIQEWVPRLVSILYGMLGLSFLYLLTQKVWTRNVALLTCFIAGLSPLNWFYHRAVMTDTSMVTAMLGGFYYFYLWLESPEKSRYLIYSGLWTAATGLFKPFGMMIGVSYLCLILLQKRWNIFKQWKLYVFAILVWVPSLVWIAHVFQLEEGVTEFSDSNNMNQLRHLYLLWSPEFYNRIILSRLVDLLLTPWAAMFAVIGIWSIKRQELRYHIPISWMAGNLFYLAAIQRGNYVHDYYQLPFVPGLALFAAIGVWVIWNSSLRLQTKQIWITTCALFFIIHSTKYAHNHFRMNIGSYLVGQKISELVTHPDEKVLAFDIGADKRNQMIYYSGQVGWYFKETEVERLKPYIEKGARWLGVNITQTQSQIEKYMPVAEVLPQYYKKVWELTDTTDRYGRPVLLQIYDLKN